MNVTVVSSSISPMLDPLQLVGDAMVMSVGFQPTIGEVPVPSVFPKTARFCAWVRPHPQTAVWGSVERNLVALLNPR